MRSIVSYIPGILGTVGFLLYCIIYIIYGRHILYYLYPKNIYIYIYIFTYEIIY